jgi:hypothetical protein
VGRSVNDPLREFGRWSYLAGVSGAVVVPPGRRVLSLAAQAGAGAGSVVIDSGPPIPVPANGSVEIEPRANLTAPIVVFDQTEAYLIELVSDV